MLANPAISFTFNNVTYTFTIAFELIATTGKSKITITNK